jgi:hypothetical protein
VQDSYDRANLGWQLLCCEQLEVIGGKRWQIPPAIFLEQTKTRFPITVTSANIEADTGRGADVKDSWHTRKETVQHLQIIRFSPTICIQLFFHTIWADGKNRLKKFIKKIVIAVKMVKVVAADQH